ncbi:hypothetical protein BDV3_003535 [Batrachochytrium dendrobatidis]|nr:hypothetical protein BDEG_21903 [Batrachochytrium dendrobatidis JEL423]
MTILFIKQLPFQKIKVKTVLWPEDKTDQNVEFLDLANGMQTETPPADGGLQGSLLSGIGSLSDTHTLEHILLKQQEIRNRLQSTTRTLQVFNIFSAARFSENSAIVQDYAKLLSITQSDLEQVFQRVRALKRTVADAHADKYQQVISEIGPMPELED